MKWTVVQLGPFVNRWKSERLSDEDLQALESDIMENPFAGAVMKETGGLRKMRFAPPSRGKGKSGSMRIGYAQFPEFETLFLITMFLKKDDANLSRGDRHTIKAWIKQIADDLKKGRRP